jgi:hypothetical protein
MPASDLFSTHQPGLASPYTHAAAVTPHNTDELTHVSRALYVGTAGTLKVTTVSGEEVSFGAVTAGSLIPVRVKIVWATGTSASNIVSLC